jgi:predicted permease
LPEEERESILGDLVEEAATVPKGGAWRGSLWLWRQVVAIAVRLLIERLRNPEPRAVTKRPRKGDTLMQGLWRDVRLSVRTLAKAPGFTLVAVSTLALGIGANTAMFSVLNTFFFRALPYPESDQIVRVFRTSPNSQSWPHSPANFFDYRDQNTVFESIAAYTQSSINLAEPGEPAERLQAIDATAEFFQVLGVHPALGRVFTRDEEVTGNNGVVLLSHSFWMRRFGGDPAVLGRTLNLNGRETKIVGVMPPSAEYPLLWGPIDLWDPKAFTPEGRGERRQNYLQAIARLKPGVTREHAEEAMAALAANIGREYGTNQGQSLRLEPLHRSVSDDVGRTVLWFTFGLAGFVLLIACANLANLQLVRTASRSREYAVRVALGAGRARVLRQSLTESLVVSFAGGALSLALAYACVEFLGSRLFGNLPGARVSLDARVFGFALLCSVATGLVFGTVPAWLASRADANQVLRDNARGSTAGRTHHRLRNALVVGEVAFALVLLTGAVLFLRGLEWFTQLDPGWDVDGLLTARVTLVGPGYGEAPQRAGFYRRLEERLGALPGVEGVALSSSQPAWGLGMSTGRVVEGEPEPPPEQKPLVAYEVVSPNYFETLGVPLLEGRAFTPDDTAGRPPVVIVNETMARRFWPGQSAIGKRIGRGTVENRTWETIVGVVGDVGSPTSLRDPETELQAFYPIADQAPWGGVSVTLRTSGAPEALAGGVRRAVAEVDPGQAVYQIDSTRAVVEQALGSISLLATLLGAFAALGLVLAVIGIYGVTSYSVAQRTGEIGIRMALGAQRRDVLRLVLARGALLTLAGAALGVGGGYAISRLLEAAIPTLPPRDPVALVVLTLALVAVALVACYLPARKATRVDPLVALRHE